MKDTLLSQSEGIDETGGFDGYPRPIINVINERGGFLALPAMLKATPGPSLCRQSERGDIDKKILSDPTPINYIDGPLYTSVVKRIHTLN